MLVTKLNGLTHRRLKIALVVDQIDWAFGFIAKRVAHDIADTCDVTILATQSMTRSKLLKSLQELNCDIVHFFWRKELSDIIDELSDNPRYLKYRAVFLNCRLSFSIPDHLYSSTPEIFAQSFLFNICSGYIVTSEKLAAIYREVSGIPSPKAVIHDLYLTSKTLNTKPENDRITLVWIGNSRWGEWLNFQDYKGVKTIIDPLFAKLRETYGDRVETILIDSAVTKLPKSEISKILTRCDIVLCASVAEGTPLPLLEALEAGCAIITTDVGIAKTILPAEQRQFIVARNPEAFLNAAMKLVEEESLLRNIQRANVQCFAEIDRVGSGPAWTEYFYSLMSSAKPDMLKDRLLLNPQHRGLAPAASKLIRSNKVLHAISRISAPNRRKVSRDALRRIETTMAEVMVHRKMNRDALFIANPKWLGVFHSTLILSRGACLPYPRLTWRNPDSIREEEIGVVATALAESMARKFVFSGGELCQLRLASQLRKRLPHAEINIVWHGQLAQWVSAHERDLFYKWMDLLMIGTINKIGVLKESMDKVLKKVGLPAFRLSNFIDEWHPIIGPAEHESKELRLGLWTASNEYRKNVYSQMLSIPLLEKKSILHHAFGENDLTEALDRFKIRNCRVGTGTLPHSRLHEAMSQTDLTLYISLGECSPMVPLEGMAAGSPAIVGPVSDIYGCDEFLSRLLVVKAPETPAAIADHINQSSTCLSEVLGRRDSFLAKTREIGISRLDYFLDH